jgi:hypothetical protein
MLAGVVPARARVLAPAALAGFALARALPAAAQAPDPAQLLADAVAKIGALTSYRFKLETLDGVTRFMDTLELSTIEGEVSRPDAFSARGTVKIAFVSLDVSIIAVGGRLWVSDPTSDSGAMIEATDLMSGSGIDPTILVNPERLLLPAIAYVQNPAITGEDEIDGVKTTVITGTVDLVAALGDLATPAAEMGLTLPASVPVTVHLDGEGRVVRVVVAGPILPDEEPRISRQLDLFDFDATIEIVAPA